MRLIIPQQKGVIEHVKEQRRVTAGENLDGIVHTLTCVGQCLGLWIPIGATSGNIFLTHTL